MWDLDIIGLFRNGLNLNPETIVVVNTIKNLSKKIYKIAGS